MNVEHIIVSGPFHQEIKKLVESRPHLNKQFKYVSESEVSDDDYQWADVFVGIRLPPNFQFGNLKWVHSFGAGIDGFLFGRKWRDDVVLTRTIGSFGPKISEYCLSYILMDIQQHRMFGKNQASREWARIRPSTIADQKFVIYGTGEIGQAIAKVLSAFGAAVAGVSLTGSPKPYFSRTYKLQEVKPFLSEFNYVINTLPLTGQTEKLFNSEIFNDMNNACFMNVGRGKSVDEEDLIGALDRQKVRLAVLDVFHKEPLDPDSKFWERPDVIVTPHIAAFVQPVEAWDIFLHTLSQLEQDRMPENQVDIEKGY